MGLEDLKTDYLTEPGLKARAPMETAEDYVKSMPSYKRCIEKGYFTKLELAIFFAQLKAHSDCLTISAASGQLVDVPGLDDASKLHLADQLRIEVEDLDRVIQKVTDGLDRVNAEKARKVKNAPAGI